MICSPLKKKGLLAGLFEIDLPTTNKIDQQQYQ
jgi:hypothetical protein